MRALEFTYFHFREKRKPKFPHCWEGKNIYYLMTKQCHVFIIRQFVKETKYIVRLQETLLIRILMNGFNN